MDTKIRYLKLIHEDLVDAGGREARRGGRRGSGIRDRFSGRAFVAAAAAVTLLAAGTIGWFATGSNQDRFRSLFSPLERDAATTAGSTGATDATGVNFGALSVPQATPASGDFTGFMGGANVDASIGDISRVIRTAELGLVIPPDSFEDRFAQVADLASANGGFIATSTTRKRSGSLTLRVPAASFDETLGGLRDLGDVEVQTIQGKDVTADYVDLQARLRIAKSRRGVLLRLMGDATSIEQTIRVQNALDDTQLRVEELQGQLRLLDDRVALATIQVSLREEGVEPAQDIDTPSIPNAFERSVAGFVGVIAGVVVGLGYLIPIALIGIAVWFVVSRIRRRRLA